MDPQGPKYPMGVYLDELRVMEIFEGSPAEKAASLSRPTSVHREIHIGNFQGLIFDSSRGKNVSPGSS